MSHGVDVLIQERQISDTWHSSQNQPREKQYPQNTPHEYAEYRSIKTKVRYPGETSENRQTNTWYIFLYPFYSWMNSITISKNSIAKIYSIKSIPPPSNLITLSNNSEDNIIFTLHNHSIHCEFITFTMVKEYLIFAEIFSDLTASLF